MTRDVRVRLGQRIKALRGRRAMTQEQLAERCGWSVKFVSEIERGKVNVPFLTLCALTKALGHTVSEVAVGVDAPLPRGTRTVERLLAGRAPGQQAAVVRLLEAVADLLGVPG